MLLLGYMDKVKINNEVIIYKPYYNEGLERWQVRFQERDGRIQKRNLQTLEEVNAFVDQLERQNQQLKFLGRNLSSDQTVDAVQAFFARQCAPAIGH